MASVDAAAPPAERHWGFVREHCSPAALKASAATWLRVFVGIGLSQANQLRAVRRAGRPRVARLACPVAAGSAHHGGGD